MTSVALRPERPSFVRMPCAVESAGAWAEDAAPCGALVGLSVLLVRLCERL